VRFEHGNDRVFFVSGGMKCGGELTLETCCYIRMVVNFVVEFILLKSKVSKLRCLNDFVLFSS